MAGTFCMRTGEIERRSGPWATMRVMCSDDLFRGGEHVRHGDAHEATILVRAGGAGHGAGRAARHVA